MFSKKFKKALRAGHVTKKIKKALRAGFSMPTPHAFTRKTAARIDVEVRVGPPLAAAGVRNEPREGCRPHRFLIKF